MEHSQSQNFSLSSRRQAAEALPPCEIPQMQADQAVPRGGAGFSPGQSSIHTTSSHGSQPSNTMSQQYTLGHSQSQGQMSPWTTAATNGSASHYSTASPVQPHPYSHTPQPRQGSLGHLDHRGPNTPLGFSPDPLAGTAYGQQEPRSFQPSVPSHVPSQLHGLQAPTTLASQQGTAAHSAAQSNGQLHVETYNGYRHSNGNGFALGSSPSPQNPYASYSSQISPNQQSPTGLVAPRGVGTGGVGPYGQASPAAVPPSPFRNYPGYYHGQQVQSPINSINGHGIAGMSHHGGQGGLLTTMAAQSHYAQHHHAYQGVPAPLDRPFKCDQCTQSFSRNHDLKRHKRIHLEVKPFQCDFCQKQFSRKDALKRHRLVKGCEEKEKTTDSTGRDCVTVDTHSDSDNSMPSVIPTRDQRYAHVSSA